MRLNEFIYTYLTEHKISQRQFARQCGLSNGYISMLINNSNPQTGRPLVPSLNALLAISKGMGITFDELLTKIEDTRVNISDTANLLHPALTEREEQLLDNFRELNDEGQLAAISVLTGLAAQPLYKKYNPLSTSDEKQA